MINPKLEPPVDFYRERVERIDSTPEARLLRYEIAVAVDAYAHYLERHGLQVHISLGRDTKPSNNPDNVVMFTSWDSARQGYDGGGEAA